MKRTLFFLLLTFVFFACGGDDSDDNPYGDWVTTIFKIIDRDTQKPISGAYLRIFYTMRPGGVEMSWDGTSNDQGEVKWEHREDWTLVENKWFASKDHYKDIGCHSSIDGPLKITIELQYATYFKFHLINDEPTSNEDKITINYRTLVCVYQGPIEIEGADIDQIIIAEASPFHNYSITVEATGANELKETYEFDWKSRDTTLIEIRY